MTIVQPLRLEEDISRIIELRSRDDHINKTTAIKQFLYVGIEDYLLKLCSQGRISIGKVAEILKKSIYDIQELAKKRNIELGIKAEDYEKSKRTAKLLL